MMVPNHQQFRRGVVSFLGTLFCFACTFASAESACPLLTFDDLETLASEESSLALVQLADRYDKGSGVKQDLAKAFTLYRQAALKADARAQYLVGLAYQNGRGVKQNRAEAARWYEKASEQGNADAQRALGIQYANGTGVNTNRRKAARLLRQAADQNHPGAQYSLGMLYEAGLGVQKSMRRAKEYYEMSASQGNTRAQLELGLAFVEERRLEAGRAWLCLVSRGKGNFADRAMKEIRESGQDSTFCAVNEDKFAGIRGEIRRPQFEEICLASPTPQRAIANVEVETSVPSPAAIPGQPSQKTSQNRGVSNVATASMVTGLQALLIQHRYLAGPADGLLGPGTRNAVREVFTDAGMPSLTADSIAEMYDHITNILIAPDQTARACNPSQGQGLSQNRWSLCIEAR